MWGFPQKFEGRKSFKGEEEIVAFKRISVQGREENVLKKLCMFGWHHRLNGHEFEKAPGDNEGQGILEC